MFVILIIIGFRKMLIIFLLFFYDIDFLCKMEKFLVNFNLNNMLDKKVVGMFVVVVFSLSFILGFL